MKILITYIQRCVRCDEETALVMRDTNINSNIKDSDVYTMASEYIKSPPKLEWCEVCKLNTKQEITAFDF